MMQLRRSGLVSDVGDIPALAREFQQRHCVVLPSLIAPDLLQDIDRHLEAGQWRDETSDGIGLELVLAGGIARDLAFFLVNVPAFLDAVRAITGCTFSAFRSGRIYRMIPQQGHFDSWHSDDTDHRSVGMSINLSRRRYEGGLFQLRQRRVETPIAEVANTGWGDALLFRISPELVHRVGPIAGHEPKTAFAGWFQAGVDGLHPQARARR